MIDLKTIWLCAMINFSKWKVNPRIYTLAAIIVAFAIWVFSWIADYAAAVGVPVSPWVFPFFLTRPIMVSIFGCLTLLLFCDAPFTDSHTPFLMIRTSRRNWVLGQLLYIMMAAFVYTAFFVVASVVALIPHLQLTADWGAVLRTIAYNPSSLSKYGITSLADVAGPAITLFSPVQAMFISFGLFALVSIFIGVLIFCFNIVLRRMSGLIVAGGFTVLSYFSIYVGKMSYGNAPYYISPINWSSMIYLDFGYTGSMPSPIYAVTVLVGSIVLMSIVSVIVFCKQDVSILERRA
ncbi:hypothetical protein [Paenibacillus sp. YYML68]|uniref:hypothetical protein n=1 Tax=Paenibacillus sp. YYML68 TaxID=2909250 RepID=UPI002491D6E6|nr:hypothetical protein [Paenibacillus sp. YYML68]